MTRKSSTRRRPEVDATPRIDVVQSNTLALTGSGFSVLLESVAQQILAITYWFDPALHPDSYAVTIRFSSRRVDVQGRLRSGDKFVQDETFENVVPGSGPISLTARVRGINPGEWVVTAHMIESAHSSRRPRAQENATPPTGSPGPAAQLWRRWAPPVESEKHVRTCLTPFARVPGILPGIWGAMVMLGMAVALALQFLVISRDHLAVGPWWAVSLVGIAVGIIGAKVWYIVFHRREHSING